MGKIDKNKTTTTKAFRRQQPLKKSNKENEKVITNLTFYLKAVNFDCFYFFTFGY